MSRAIVEPGELRRFAQFLRRSNDEMRRQIHMVQAQLNNLSNTWRDQEHEKFVEEFGQQVQAITNYMESTDEYVRFLLRKAERVEEYLQQR
jgi:uncharacterized protein YukE